MYLNSLNALVLSLPVGSSFVIFLSLVHSAANSLIRSTSGSLSTISFKPLSNRNILDSDKKIIVKKCDKIKTLTANLVPCSAIETYFIPYIDPLEISGEKFNINDETIDSSFQPPVRIIIKKGKTYLSDEKIKNNVAKIIVDYFNENDKLGATINLSKLYQSVMSLGYIDSIKTVYYNNKNNYIYKTDYQL